MITLLNLWNTETAPVSSNPYHRPTPRVPLGHTLKQIERDKGVDASIFAMEQALSRPNPPPSLASQAFIQSSSILDWATTSASSRVAEPSSPGQASAPRFLREIGDSLHPKAVLARQFILLALEASEPCALGVAEQLAHHESLCLAWRGAAVPEPFPTQRLFALWAKQSPAWMLGEPALCQPMLSLLEDNPSARGPELHAELAGRPWLSEALSHWKSTRMAYHKKFLREMFSASNPQDRNAKKAADDAFAMTARNGSTDAVGQSLATQLGLWVRIAFDHQLLSPEEDPDWLREAARALGGIDMSKQGATSAFFSEAERQLMAWICPAPSAPSKPRGQRL
jgi:hypothetical protein